MLEVLQDLNELIRNTQIEQTSYVYFNSTSGKIYKIGPKSTEYKDKNYLVVENTSVTDILSGKKSLSQFVVLFDEREKGYKLKPVESFDTFDYKTFIKISTDEKNKKNADLIITQDFTKQEWRVQFSKDLYNMFSEHLFLTEHLLTFSITEKNDPNVLYKCISKPLFKYFHSLEHVYKGITVDEWNNDHRHFSGQHVYYKNKVYQILKNQKENTPFTEKNTKLIVSNVKLYNDVDAQIYGGDHVIKEKLIYLFRVNWDKKYLQHSIPFTDSFEFNKIPVSVFISNNFSCFFEVINEQV